MDCRKIDIDNRPYAVYKFLDMLKKGELVIPDCDKGDESRNSEFIEGMMIGAVPKHMLIRFSFNKEENKTVYTVLDGKKRLKTIIDFINNRFALKGMEFLTQLEGLTFVDLHNSLARTIEETTFNAIVIRDVHNDADVTNSIIRRFS